jgi:hypothetical protein
MPARGHSTAPTFDGNPLNLNRFFEEVEILAADAGIDDAGRIKHSLRYASLNDYELWNRLPTATEADYAAFKKSVLDLYPGTEDDHRYTVADLDRLTRTQSSYGIRTRAELGEYYREFIRIVGFLFDKGRISERERNLAYENGFHTEFKQSIKTRMQHLFPTHFYTDPYDYQEFHNCAHFLLAGTAAEPAIVSRLPSSAAARLPTPATRPADPILPKTESADTSVADLMRLVSQQMTVLTQAITKREPHHKAQEAHDHKQNIGTCWFCGSPLHRIRDCVLCTQYIHDGLCMRNDQGQIVLPNGMYLPKSIVANTLKERFDIWHAQNPGKRAPVERTPTETVQRDSLPYVSTNFVSIIDMPTYEPEAATEYTEILQSTEPDSDDTEQQIRVLEAEIQRLRRKASTVQIDPTIPNPIPTNPDPIVPTSASAPSVTETFGNPTLTEIDTVAQDLWPFADIDIFDEPDTDMYALLSPPPLIFGIGPSGHEPAVLMNYLSTSPPPFAHPPPNAPLLIDTASLPPLSPSTTSSPASSPPLSPVGMLPGMAYEPTPVATLPPAVLQDHITYIRSNFPASPASIVRSRQYDLKSNFHFDGVPIDNSDEDFGLDPDPD